MTFTAAVIAGQGRGRGLGSPTLNLDLADIPEALEEGVFAVRASDVNGVMHYGPRPTLGFERSCEVHLLGNGELRMENGKLTVEIVEQLRDVQKFENEEVLKKQIAQDIANAQKSLE